MYPARLPDVHSSQDALLKLQAMEFPTAYEQLQKVGDVYTFHPSGLNWILFDNTLSQEGYLVSWETLDSSRNMQVTKSDTMSMGSQSGDCR